MHAGDLDAQLGVPLGAVGEARRINPPRPMRMIRRRGDRQQVADRLDPMDVAVVIDERDHRFDGRSSSAWAKYADDFRGVTVPWTLGLSAAIGVMLMLSREIFRQRDAACGK
ncbi:hypothetical protein OB2597_05065 [Pseudooceanicola batsensis HTCC2597]|uniref:Uncharacterized protein n=1 Tax=Pseudooceanicola batsensis (strain ATCC BAA-863 / DSM 15984 / KCTC 12145 / HTCC2597) TaxID=252305 RepID=A3TSJ8_PSEBH|nr:hypothetical protein OB2597_05065 [Pseudooceanicola batsensis HTCC2597]